MKGFYIEITNNLLDPKHYKAMGESVWLYMWLLDRITSINENGVGKVLNNTEITYELVCQELPMSKRTYLRYIDRLRDHGYVKTIKVKYGLIIVVTKAKKTFGRSVKYGTSQNPVVPKLSRSGDKNGTSAQSSGDKNGTSLYKEDTNIMINNTNTSNVELQKQVRLVFDFFITNFGNNPKQYKLSKQRQLKIKARLKDAGEELILAAISNTASSSWHRGDNDRGWQADLDFIIRSYEQVERLANMGREGDGKSDKEVLQNYV